MSTAALPKSYSPKDFEPAITAKWHEARAFHADPNAPGEPFSIVIPPPNVTAALHLGHALNNTLQDVLIRAHRMGVGRKQYKVLWMPGTDHAGIATQSVVEKRLQLEGKKRTDFSRDEFIALVQQWKDEYEATITEQLKSMGASCDFERQRFTMDPVCAKAVREAFFRLFRDGLVYRGKRLVNWDPVSQTALADDEVEMEEVDGQFYYLRYTLVHPSTNKNDPLDCQEVTWSELAARGYPGAGRRDEDEIAWVTVATTRPETYLGDTAVAVSPKDPRARSLEGLCVQLPLVGRVIPIVADDYVVMPDEHSNDPKAKYATGFLKVTPAHDPNDWEIGQRHNLPVINVMAPDASISDKHGWEDVGDAKVFLGKTREAARKLVVKEFEARKLLENVKPYRHSVGHSYRSHVPVEPYLSDQWYVKVSDDKLVGEAQRALSDEQFEGRKPQRLAPGSARGSNGNTSQARSATEKSPPAEPEAKWDSALEFFPARYSKMYQGWHESLRDWCISRQLWWGHRIPVWRKSGDVSEMNRITYLLPDIVPDDEDTFLSEVEGHKYIFRVTSETAEQIAVDPRTNNGEAFVCLRSENPMIATRLEQQGFTQDPDVLDTWFSSALWPMSTMGWPSPGSFPDEIPEGEALLDTFNPTSVLLTAREIITLWVSRMVMFGRYFNHGKVPFRDVYIHAMIQDGHGQKMSKSLGNGVDPRDIIHSHGADAMRFTLVQMATGTQDVRLPVDIICPHCNETFHPKEITASGGYRVAAPQLDCIKCNKPMASAYGAATGEVKPSDALPLARNTSSKFDLGRNFANKLWNAARFALSNLDVDAQDKQAQPMLVDKWIINRLHSTLHKVEDAVTAYQFAPYAEAMYDFIWRDFCDWYLEAIKPTVKTNAAQQQVLRTVLNAALRLLHPIMPFVTEALWPSVQEAGAPGLAHVKLGPSELLATAPWPDIACKVHDKEADALFERMQNLVNAIRNVRGEHKVQPKQKIGLVGSAGVMELITKSEGVIESLAGLDDVQDRSASGGDAPRGAVAFTFDGDEILLTGVAEELDSDAERARLAKLVQEKEKAIASLKGRLSNEAYVSKAPAHLVEETKTKLAEAESDLAQARGALQSLGSM